MIVSVRARGLHTARTCTREAERRSARPPTPHPAPAPSVLSWNVLEKVLALTTLLGPANRFQPLLSVLGPCR